MISHPPRIFIDGGGNSYQSVLKYLDRFKADLVYVFEPNPKFHSDYDSRVILIKKAIWTEDVKLPLYISKDSRQAASSLLIDKLCKVNGTVISDWDDKPIEVECVDFSKWLSDNIPIGAILTIKLDIEGAEYPVLKKLIETRVIQRVSQLLVEFHLHTLPHMKSTHAELMLLLQDANIKPLDWD